MTQIPCKNFCRTVKFYTQNLKDCNNVCFQSCPVTCIEKFHLCQDYPKYVYIWQTYFVDCSLVSYNLKEKIPALTGYQLYLTNRIPSVNILQVSKKTLQQCSAEPFINVILLIFSRHMHIVSTNNNIFYCPHKFKLSINRLK